MFFSVYSNPVHIHSYLPERASALVTYQPTRPSDSPPCTTTVFNTSKQPTLMSRGRGRDLNLLLANRIAPLHISKRTGSPRPKTRYNESRERRLCSLSTTVPPIHPFPPATPHELGQVPEARGKTVTSARLRHICSHSTSWTTSALNLS